MSYHLQSPFKGAWHTAGTVSGSALIAAVEMEGPEYLKLIFTGYLQCAVCYATARRNLVKVYNELKRNEIIHFRSKLVKRDLNWYLNTSLSFNYNLLLVLSL